MASETEQDQLPAAHPASREALHHLREALEAGADWTTALLEAMALWTEPCDTYDGRRFDFFIGGEAFDWLLLAERMLLDAGGLVPQEDKETLLFTGRLPGHVSEGRFRQMLGVEKYRAHLNFYYGVTVEDALQLAVEEEVCKQRVSNGLRPRKDVSDEVFTRIYRASRRELLAAFHGQKGRAPGGTMSVSMMKEFTYWLFKHRLRVSDRARVASDTRKGLERLARMRPAVGRPTHAV